MSLNGSEFKIARIRILALAIEFHLDLVRVMQLPVNGQQLMPGSFFADKRLFRDKCNEKFLSFDICLELPAKTCRMISRLLRSYAILLYFSHIIHSEPIRGTFFLASLTSAPLLPGTIYYHFRLRHRRSHRAHSVRPNPHKATQPNTTRNRMHLLIDTILSVPAVSLVHRY